VFEFLVSLQDASNAAYRKKLATKIEKSGADFATLAELDRRLGLPEDGDGS
jgi:parvulin-like peptidyl-prolyl isomerase